MIAIVKPKRKGLEIAGLIWQENGRLEAEGTTAKRIANSPRYLTEADVLNKFTGTRISAIKVMNTAKIGDFVKIAKQ